MIDVLILGGTWAAQGDGVTGAFADALDPARFQSRMVPYPADYGRQVSYAASRASGLAALVKATAASPNPVVVAGYSQGAGIAGDLAAAVGAGAYPELDIRAAALIADPLRPAGRCLGRDPGGYGIAGQRPIKGIRAFWVAAAGDPITSLPPGDPLRLAADLTAWACINSPATFLRWGQELIDTAWRRRFQRWSLANWRGWGEALTYLRGYVSLGRHTSAYVDEGHAQMLAAAVNHEVAE